MVVNAITGASDGRLKNAFLFCLRGVQSWTILFSGFLTKTTVKLFSWVRPDPTGKEWETAPTGQSNWPLHINPDQSNDRNDQTLQKMLDFHGPFLHGNPFF